MEKHRNKSNIFIFLHCGITSLSLHHFVLVFMYFFDIHMLFPIRLQSHQLNLHLKLTAC